MKHILLVNGHDDSRSILKQALAHQGYQVSDESTSDAALDVARSAAPDLIIIELYLHPVDGETVIRELRTDPSTRDIPIICLTSRVMESDRQSAMNAGADVFLPKPLTPREVIGRVQELLGAVPAE